MQKKEINIIVVGCGNMGSSHARSYHRLPGFNLVGLVDRNIRNRERLSDQLGGIDQFDDFDTAMIAKNLMQYVFALIPIVMLIMH